MNAIAIGQVERHGRPNRSAASGAYIARDSLAMRPMPSVLDLPPRQALSFLTGMAAVELPDCGPLFVPAGPIDTGVVRLLVGGARPR